MLVYSTSLIRKKPTIQLVVYSDPNIVLKLKTRWNNLISLTHYVRKPEQMLWVIDNLLKNPAAASNFKKFYCAGEHHIAQFTPERSTAAPNPQPIIYSTINVDTLLDIDHKTLVEKPKSSKEVHRAKFLIMKYVYDHFYDDCVVSNVSPDEYADQMNKFTEKYTKKPMVFTPPQQIPQDLLDV